MTEFIQTVILGLLVGGVYALLASGLTLIFGVMKVINIAHGALVILAAFLTYSLWTATGIDPLLAILITTPAMMAFGWLLYLASVGRIRNAPVGASVLLTFGLALVLEGADGARSGATPRTRCGRPTSTSPSRSVRSSCPRPRSTAARSPSWCWAASTASSTTPGWGGPSGPAR